MNEFLSKTFCQTIIRSNFTLMAEKTWGTKLRATVAGKVVSGLPLVHFAANQTYLRSYWQVLTVCVRSFFCTVSGTRVCVPAPPVVIREAPPRCDVTVNISKPTPGSGHSWWPFINEPLTTRVHVFVVFFKVSIVQVKTPATAVYGMSRRAWQETRVFTAELANSTDWLFNYWISNWLVWLTDHHLVP